AVARPKKAAPRPLPRRSLSNYSPEHIGPETHPRIAQALGCPRGWGDGIVGRLRQTTSSPESGIVPTPESAASGMLEAAQCAGPVRQRRIPTATACRTHRSSSRGFISGIPETARRLELMDPPTSSTISTVTAEDRRNATVSMVPEECSAHGIPAVAAIGMGSV
ncbi:MAG: hypothetical protein RLZZ436_1601, partial [Planctomycetota bacterium]